MSQANDGGQGQTSKLITFEDGVVTLAGEEVPGILRSLRVDGRLEGAVDNARHVIVGDGGRIAGDVTAQVVVCGGEIEGNICADMLEVLAKARIKGDIRAKKMIVEEGGRIEGHCAIGGEEEASETDALPKK